MTEGKRAYNAHATSVLSAIGQFLTWLDEDTKEEFIERLKEEQRLFKAALADPRSVCAHEMWPADKPLPVDGETVVG